MKRFFLMLALLWATGVADAVAQTDTAGAPRTIGYLALGAGVTFPQFESEDNVRANYAFAGRVSIFPVDRLPLGGWLDVNGLAFRSDEELATVEMTNLIATGQHSLQRSAISFHLGVEYAPMVRRGDWIRPRFALGGGVAVFNVTEKIEVDGLIDDTPINLRRKYSTVPELTATVGMILPTLSGNGYTFGLDLIWSVGGKVDITPEEGGDKHRLSTVTLLVSLVYPLQRHSPKPRVGPTAEL